MKKTPSWSCRKQGPRPNLPRRPGGPRQNRTPGERLVRVGTNLLCLMAFVSGAWVGVVAYREGRQALHDLFALREVEVTGLVHVSRDEVLGRLALPEDRTLFTVSPPELVRNLKGHPWIREARVTRRPFHTVAIEISERQPAAVLRTSSGTMLLDTEGAVLTTLPGTDDSILPVLVGIDPVRLREGEASVRRVAQAGIRLANLLGESYQGRPEVDLSNPDNAVGTVQGLQFAFGSAAFEEKWMQYHKVAETVGARLVDGSEGGRRLIDLRYPGKVIVRERG
jgi:cell division septal protein FtsQ